jgi:hypothetical protein
MFSSASVGRPKRSRRRLEELPGSTVLRHSEPIALLCAAFLSASTSPARAMASPPGALTDAGLLFDSPEQAALGGVGDDGGEMAYEATAAAVTRAMPAASTRDFGRHFIERTPLLSPPARGPPGRHPGLARANARPARPA